MASAHVPVVSCTFLRLGCTSDHTLFAPTYTRSNRKRNEKLLRCFPHCCPSHIPRSYCGCSLHLLITFESADAAAISEQNSQLLVCARFESTSTSAIAGAGDVVSALTPGSTVALPASVTALPGLKPSESDWIRAEKADYVYQHQFPENSILYELNNRRNPMWYYSYESGSTKAQRAMKHVLAVYVLVLHSEASDISSQQHDNRSDDNGVRLATVVARQQSPLFTMVSYRRQNDGSNSGQDRTAQSTGADGCTIKLERGVLARQSEFRPPLPALAHIVQWNSVVRYSDPRSEVHHEDNVSTGWLHSTVPVREAASELQDQPKSEMGRSLHESHREHCPICQEQTAQHSLLYYRNTMDLLQPLLVLQIFMCSAPLSSFSFYFSELSSRIQSHWLDDMSPVSRNRQGRDGTARTLMEDILSAFSLKDFVLGDMELANTGAREQAILSSCALLAVEAFSSMRFQQILSSVISTVKGNQEITIRVVCEQFCQLVTDIFDTLEQLLSYPSATDNFHHGKHTTISALVDDILSLIYSEPTYRSLRAIASTLLLQKDDSVVVRAHDLFGVFTAYIQRACNDFREPEQVDEEQKLENVNMFSHGEPWMKGNSSKHESLSYRHDLSRLNNWRTGNSWCRRWLLDTSTLSVSPTFSTTSVGTAYYSVQDCNPSLLMTMFLIQALTAVDLTIEGSRMIAESAISTLFSLPALSGTVLELDGAMHALESFPSGLPVEIAATVLGDTWDRTVYSGHIAEDGLSLNILLTLLPRLQRHRRLDNRNLTSAVMARQVDVKMTLNDTYDSRKCSLSVFAEVFVADLVSHEQREISVPEYFIKDESKANRSPILEIGATYFIVSQGGSTMDDND